ncbi:MAG: glycosyltransferase [Elusimicrobia bacterium]|nr:glycosyltransferase [Elusimicrobiota bacterium]
MTRILYVSTSTTVGGAEKTLYTLATLIDPRKFQVAGIVSLKPKGFYAQRLEEAGQRVFSLDLQGSPGFKTIRKLAEIVLETKPALVHAVMYQAIQLSRAVKTLGYGDYKLVSSPRVHYRTRTPTSLWIDKFLRSADNLLISESEASRDYLEKELKYPAAKLSTIYNGVDVASWPVSKIERKRVRDELKVGEKDVLIGAMGRLDTQKGHAYLIDAIAKLKATQPVRLVIVGDGGLRKKLEEQIQKLRAGDYITLAGEQTDVPAWMSAIDVFVLPSLWEGLPNALLEAMGMGLPVIATRVDGVPEVVKHDETGILCEPKNAQGLFVAMQDLIQDASYRARLGKAAQAAVDAKFKIRDMLASYEAAYGKVLGS